MNTLQAQFEHMAEVEWMERYYGIDTSTPDYSNIDRDIDRYDIPQYNGYWNFDFTDNDWPVAEYVEPIDWSAIPF